MKCIHRHRILGVGLVACASPASHLVRIGEETIYLCDEHLLHETATHECGAGCYAIRETACPDLDHLTMMDCYRAMSPEEFTEFAEFAREDMHRDLLDHLSDGAIVPREEIERP